MIGKFHPYETGEIREVPNKGAYMICGHIWWPVEKQNAYHCMKMQNGEPIGEPQYIWDTTDGKWPLVA